MADISVVEGLTASDLSNRINRCDWDIRRAMTQPKDVKKQPSGIGERIYEYNGKMYNSYELSQMSSIHISPSVIVQRINRYNWDIERAINTPLKNKNALYQYNGNLYTTTELADMSPYKDINKHIINDRLKDGWPIDKAINTPRKKPKTYDYNGKQYTVKELYNKFCIANISLITLSGRLRKGWNVLDALTVTNLQPSRSKSSKSRTKGSETIA